MTERRNTIHRSMVREAVEVYIDAKHTTLYLDWDITTQSGHDKAIEFITDMWLDIEEQRLAMSKTDWDHFAEGVAEAREVAEKTGLPYVLSRQRHPSYQGPEPADEPARRRYVGATDARRPVLMDAGFPALLPGEPGNRYDPSYRVDL